MLVTTDYVPFWMVGLFSGMLFPCYRVLTYREGVKGIEASRKEEGNVCKPERVTWRSGFDVSDTLRVL